MPSDAVLTMIDVQEASAIEVRESGSYKGVFAGGEIKEGSVILYLKGTVSTQPTKHTIQLGNRRHLNSHAARKPNDDPDYGWQYLNHNCEPNGYINVAELTLRALRDIARGEEITFNYLATEFELDVPFNCSCGSPDCFGFIQGRNFLSQEQANRLALAVPRSGGKARLSDPETM